MILVAPTFYRYIRAHLLVSIVFVLVAFVGLFAFFDLIAEVERLSMVGTSWSLYGISVLLGLPARVYEVAPIAALIGSVFALVQLSNSSELTAMRAAGLATKEFLCIVLRVACWVAFMAVAFGELLAPMAEEVSVPLRQKALGFDSGRGFKSGYWLRDDGPYSSSPIQLSDPTNESVANVQQQKPDRIRFINFKNFEREGKLLQLEIFEMDVSLRIRAWIQAESAVYDFVVGHWVLENVVKHRYFDAAVSSQGAALAGVTIQASPVEHYETLNFSSYLKPDLLTGLLVRPDRMSAWQLWHYSQFLSANQQDSKAIELAFFKKLVYPFSMLVMMCLALPFAFGHWRQAGVSVKVFLGIMLGIGFHLANNLFAHLSVVARLPAWLSASVPSVMALIFGLMVLWWVTQPTPIRVAANFFGKKEE